MKVTLRESSKEELAKMYPVVSYDDYQLLEGAEITLTKEEMDRVMKEKMLTIGKMQIPLKLISFDDNNKGEMYNAIYPEVAKKFVFSEDTVNILITALETDTNVILYGKGGHGKSEITEKVLLLAKEKGFINTTPFVQVCGDGLTEEKLFGGMNIKKYRQEGVIEYLPENSFMNHEIVVFEEIFDAPANILLSLKDIMTSKRFRQGNETFDVKTKVIIGLTNKSKEEFSKKDDSLKALAERFPLTLKVEWDNYGAKSYKTLFSQVFGEKFCEEYGQNLNTLADIIDYNNVNGHTFISPRTAVKAAELFCAGKELSYIGDLDNKLMEGALKQQRENRLSSIQNKFIDSVYKYIDENELDVMSASEEFLAELEKIGAELGDGDVEKNPAKDLEKQEKAEKLQFISQVVNRYCFIESLMPKAAKLNKTINNLVNKMK